MIAGIVNDYYDALNPLRISGDDGNSRQIEAVIDTGFNGFLTLPPSLIAELEGNLIGTGRAILADGEERLFPLYDLTVSWDGELRAVEVDAADADPLVGMAMMDGFELKIEVKPRGRVTLQPIR
jgi:clan AA aspartic protease